MITPSSPLRVLVVDDEPLICWFIAETLRGVGDVVLEARTGAAAMRALSESDSAVHVVLLDYKLPDVHDFSLLSAVRRISPASRVIVMSAHLTPEGVSQALSLGASRVIHKPVDMHEVSVLVHDGAPSPTN